MTDVIDHVILADKSPKSVAMAYHGALFIAWKGDGNDSLSIMSSIDYGKTFTNKYVSKQTSPQAPALCVHNEQLYLAWKGDGNDKLNVAQVLLQGNVVTGLAPTVTLGDTSPFTPSLVSFGGQLYLAWTGNDNHLNLMSSSDNGKSFGNKLTSPETSDQGPSLCLHNALVFIGWKGHGNNNLNLAQVGFAGGKVNSLAGKVTSPETSAYTPSLQSFNGALYLSWTGTDGRLNVSESTDNGKTFGNKYTSAQTSNNGPTICTYGRALEIAWAGRDDRLNVAQATNTLIVGSLRPKYQVLNLLYAPPGTNGGHSTSVVDYGGGSTTGTTTSTRKSFTSGGNVSVSVGVDVGVVKLGAAGSYTWSEAKADATSVEIKKSTTLEIKVSGPATDGINHDEDLFVLWLNPLINVTVDPANNIAWSPGVDGPTMNIVYVYAAWLRRPNEMEVDIQKALTAAGLTSADYQTILAMNPFAQGPAPIDPLRFLPLTQSFPYTPPLNAGDPVPSTTYTQQTTSTQKETHTVTHDYTVTASASANINFVVTVGAGGGAKFIWSNTTETTAEETASQSASVTIGGPAFGYAGPTEVLVYWDTLFNSFMFDLAIGVPSAQGVVYDAANKPLANRPIFLDVDGETLSTRTGADGSYSFYNVPAGAGTFRVAKGTFAAPIAARGKADIHLTA